MSMLKPIINVYRNPPKYHLFDHVGFLGSSTVKNLPANEGDLQTWVQPPNAISSGEGNGKPLQYSCLEKSHEQRSLMEHSQQGSKESDTIERLSMHACTYTYPQIFCKWTCFRLIGYLEETLIMLKDSSHKDYSYGVWIMTKDGFKVKNLVWYLKQVTVEIRIKKMGEITLSCWDAPSRRCSTY